MLDVRCWMLDVRFPSRASEITHNHCSGIRRPIVHTSEYPMTQHPSASGAGKPQGPPESADDVAVMARLCQARDRVKEQISKVVVGQNDIIDSLLISLLCRGH